jgi:hypothetical protein
MVTIRVKGDIPEEGSSLCVSCRWGTVRSGYGAAGAEAFCRIAEHSPRVPFKVREYSSSDDRRIPSRYHTERIGWVRLTKSAGRSIGFVTSEKFRELEGQDAEIIPETPITQNEPWPGHSEGCALGFRNRFSITQKKENCPVPRLRRPVLSSSVPASVGRASLPRRMSNVAVASCTVKRS